MHWEKSKYAVVIKRGSPVSNLHFSSVKIKQVKKFKYLVNVIIDDGNSDTEIKKHIRIANNYFEKLIKLLKDKLPLET